MVCDYVEQYYLPAHREAVATGAAVSA
jgi:hypothetical protein